MNRRHFFLAAGAVALSPALSAPGAVKAVSLPAGGLAPLSANAKQLLATLHHLNSSAISQPASIRLYDEIVELKAHGLLAEPFVEKGVSSYSSIDGEIKGEDAVVFEFTPAGKQAAADHFDDALSFDPYSAVHLTTTTGPESYTMSAGLAA